MRWTLLVVACALALPARADAALEDEVNAAIAKGVAYLKRVQKKAGNWADRPDRTGGITALALYALSASGVPATDSSIRRGVAWTLKHRGSFGSRGTYGTYSASLLVLALTRIDPWLHRKRIGELTDALLRAQNRAGGWGYRLRPGTGGDNSNSQFAILALWAAQELGGLRVPEETWRRIQTRYATSQAGNGTWGYRASGSGVGRPSMTCAGLVSYVCATAALAGGAEALPMARDTPIARLGLGALGTRFDYRNYYFVYSLERVGTVLAVREERWYVPGARALVDAQAKSGRWGPGRGRGDAKAAYETSLALLFLTRATRPAVTPGARVRGPTTKRESFPDPAQDVARAFEYYHVYKPERRAEVRPRFGAAGPRVVEFLIGRLRDDDARVRASAFELLQGLLDKRLFFEPAWPAADRAQMLAPIVRFWEEHGKRLKWDAERKVFVRS